MPLQSSRSTCFPPDKVKWRGKIRQSLASCGRRRGGGQEQGYRGITAEMLVQDLSRVHRAIRWLLPCSPTGLAGKQVPGPTGAADASCPCRTRLSVHTGRCWGEPRCLRVVHGPARGTDPSKCHQPAHVLCCPLGSEAEPDVATPTPTSRSKLRFP